VHRVRQHAQPAHCADSPYGSRGVGSHGTAGGDPHGLERLRLSAARVRTATCSSSATRPHDWLFPRVSAVVHHGGAGTTAAALRAGVPSVILPFFFDQGFWGRRLAACGLGPPPIPFYRLSAATLERASTPRNDRPACAAACNGSSAKLCGRTAWPGCPDNWVGRWKRSA